MNSEEQRRSTGKSSAGMERVTTSEDSYVSMLHIGCILSRLDRFVLIKLETILYRPIGMRGNQLNRVQVACNGRNSPRVLHRGDMFAAGVIYLDTRTLPESFSEKGLGILHGFKRSIESIGHLLHVFANALDATIQLVNRLGNGIRSLLSRIVDNDAARQAKKKGKAAQARATAATLLRISFFKVDTCMRYLFSADFFKSRGYLPFRRFYLSEGRRKGKRPACRRNEESPWPNR